MRACLHLLIGLIPLFVVCQLHADEFDPIRTKIRQAIDEGQVPSLTVAVARHGQVLWEEGFGWADRDQKVPANEHTPYSVASISKPITATGLMLLVQRGKLDLDHPINEYLGDAKLVSYLGDVNGATLRRVANHSSGLPLHYHFFYVDDQRTPPSYDESIRRYGVLVTPPGERFQYANFGYGLMGYLLERQSGMRYGEYLQREVFEPLGMSHSAVGVPPGLESKQALRYAGDQTPLPFYDFDHPGGSAVYSSAHDLLRFGMFHLKQKQEGQTAILSDATLDEMQRPTTPEGATHYGVGWFVAPDEHGYRVISHSGGMGGVRGRLALVPSEGIVVVTLCNASHDLPMTLAKEILGTLLPEYGKKYQESQNTQTQNGRPVANFTPPSEIIGRWEGRIATYAGNRRLQVWIQPDGDVHLQINRQLKTLLNQPHFSNGVLTGISLGDVGTDDANFRPYQLHWELKLRDGRLTGGVTAMSLPARKPGDALTYWTELDQVEDAAGQIRLLDSQGLDGWRIADTNDFAQHGPVEVVDRQLVLGKGNPGTGIILKRELPRGEYEVNLEAKRIEGSDFFCGLTFPVDEQYCTLILGGWGGGVVGLSNIDGMSAVENETTGFHEFKQDQWYAVRLRVTQKKIEAWLDEKQIVDVDRGGHKFSIWWEQEPLRPLGIATWHTKAALRHLQWKPIRPVTP